MFQERHGWERPGWFNKDGPAPVRRLTGAADVAGGACPPPGQQPFVFAKVKDYDYYGAYETKKNLNYRYEELLGREYTFDFPPHHHVVRRRGPRRSTKRHPGRAGRLDYCGLVFRLGASASPAVMALLCSTCPTLGSSTSPDPMPRRRLIGCSPPTSTRSQVGAHTHTRASLPLDKPQTGEGPGGRGLKKGRRWCKSGILLFCSAGRRRIVFQLFPW